MKLPPDVQVVDLPQDPSRKPAEPIGETPFDDAWEAASGPADFLDAGVVIAQEGVAEVVVEGLFGALGALLHAIFHF
jgi:hypothetical protein